MNIPRVYIDTSVIGGCYDLEFAKWSNGLVKDFRLGHFKPILSEVVAAEIENAPERVRQKYYEIAAYGAEELEIDTNVTQLLGLFSKSKILSDKFQRDMTHIAIATINEIDILVSWNFKHIVHFDKIRQFNAVSIKAGYKPIEIHSPREVTSYEEGI